MKLRLKDIAQEAGVSVATVDRVLNKRPGVHSRTASQVLRVMQRLGGEAPELPEPTPARPLALDFVLPAGTNTFIDMLDRSIVEAARQWRDGILAARVHRIEGFDAQALAATLTGVGKDSDGVAFIGIDHPVVREAVNELERAGTPVVTLVSDVATGRRAYVGTDNRAAGRTAGYLLGRFIRHPAGKVAMLCGSLSYRGHQEREMGFRHVLAEAFPALEIVGLSEVQDDVSQSYSRARDLLAAHPDLVGIYNIGGGNRGVAQALRETGRAQDIVFVGHDLTEHTRRFLIDGTMDAAINQDATTEARQALRLLAAAARGQEQPAHPPVRIEVFLRENLP